jgi:hypothetical protein
MQSRHRVEEFIAAFNRKDIRKDIPGALACFTDDAIYQDVTYGTHSGQDAALTTSITLYAREGQAVVGPSYGVARQRDRRAKTAGGLWCAFTWAAWVPNNLARRKRKTRRLLTNRPCQLSLRRVRFQRTSTRQQLDCAKTL